MGCTARDRPSNFRGSPCNSQLTRLASGSGWQSAIAHHNCPWVGPTNGLGRDFAVFDGLGRVGFFDGLGRVGSNMTKVLYF